MAAIDVFKSSRYSQTTTGYYFSKKNRFSIGKYVSYGERRIILIGVIYATLHKTFFMSSKGMARAPTWSRRQEHPFL